MGFLNEQKRRFGDRYDGYKVRAVDPFFVLIPHIMHQRNDSMVFFEEEVEVTELEKFVRRMRRESGLKNLNMLGVMMAAAVRMISQKPMVNRFVSGRKIYARNNITLSLSVKKEMSEEGEETVVKPEFEPTDTLYDVWKKLNRCVDDNKGEDKSNNTDLIAKIIGCLPGFLIKFVVFTVRSLDQIGKMPKFIHEFSPFHTSAYVTDIGSVGIDSVYHHLYNFGTCSFFLSIGRKRTVHKVGSDGSVSTHRMMTLRFVVDERICDGYYFGTIIRSFRKLLRNPEELLTPPSEVYRDPGLRPTRAQKKQLKLQKKQQKKEAKMNANKAA